MIYKIQTFQGMLKSSHMISFILFNYLINKIKRITYVFLHIVNILAKQHTICPSVYNCCHILPKHKIKYFTVLFSLFMKVYLQLMKANSIMMYYISVHVHVYMYIIMFQEKKGPQKITIHKVKKKIIIAPNNPKYRRITSWTISIIMFDCVILILKFHLVKRFD